jgi:hypothetical protein
VAAVAELQQHQQQQLLLRGFGVGVVGLVTPLTLRLVLCPDFAMLGHME